MSDKKEVKLNWDDFVKMGNPENAPEMPEDITDKFQPSQQQLRIHLDRKQRGGKEVTLIRGFYGPEDKIEDLGKGITSLRNQQMNMVKEDDPPPYSTTP